MLGGRMDISWDNAITDMEFRLYDLDLGEYTEFFLQTDVNLSVISSLNGSTLSLNTVTGVAGDLSNSGASNYFPECQWQRLYVNWYVYIPAFPKHLRRSRNGIWRS